LEEEEEDELGGDIGENERVRVLLAGEWSRSIAIQVECTEAHRTPADWEAEDGLRASPDGRWREREPMVVGRGDEVRFEDGLAVAAGVNARPLRPE
jgi:hypothetical protein